MVKMRPSQLNKVLTTAKNVGIGAAVTLVAGGTAVVGDNLRDCVEYFIAVSAWIKEHPVLAILICIVLVILAAKFRTLVLSIMLFIPKACWHIAKYIWKKLKPKSSF